MKLSNIIKKLNKTYSIVIIPNNSDNIRRFSFKAPFAKIICLSVLILCISIPLYLGSSKEAESQSQSIEALQQQVKTLTKNIVEQNKVLALNKNRIEALQSSDTANKRKIQEFANMYTAITSDYVTKSSRGTSSRNTDTALRDIIKLSSLVEDLNKSFTSDGQLNKEIDKTTETLENYANALPALVPVYGKITSPFGMRRHPITKLRTAHKGVDIDSAKGDPILAAASGEVVFSGYSYGYGYNVIIDHKNGFKTLYGHSSKLIVKKGDIVKKGQTIALVGSTGRSTGPHLHFEIRIDDTPVDPTEYIDFTANN